MLVVLGCIFALYGCKPKAPISPAENGPKLVSGGKSEYSVVLPKEPSQLEEFASEELLHFFETATGIVLNVVSDDAQYSEDSKYIVLGAKNKIAEKAGVSVGDGATSDSGFRLVRKDNSAFIVGKGDFGTLYGVYEFLKQTFGYEFFAETEIKIETGVRDKILPATDITDTPDIPYRQANNGMLQENELVMRRFRTNSYADVMLWGDGTGLFVHNFQIWVPVSLRNQHPEWFSYHSNPVHNMEQLCFSRKPDELREFVVNRMIEEMTAHPDLKYLTFTQTDAAEWCQCEGCAASKRKYGTDAAIYVQFTNSIAREVKAHFEKVGDPRDIQIGIFAYQDTEPAPVTTDASGKYVPIDDSVVPDDNVFLFIAPGTADYFRELADPLNEFYMENIRKWLSIVDQVFMWTYKHFVMDYLTPFYSFRSMQPNYKYFKEINTVYLFDQGQHNQNAVTDWAPLKNYLETNLMWNVDLNTEELTDKFFENYYKQAAAPMRELFEDYRLFMEYQIATDESIQGVCYPGLQAWFEKIKIKRETLTGWIGKIDEALNAIESLRIYDPALHTELENRILLESITYRHLLIELFGDSYFPDELLEMKLSFKRDVLRLGIRQYNSESEVSELFRRMGV